MEDKTPKQQQKEKFIADNYLQPEEGKVLVIREGPALPLLPPIKPNKVELKGVISAPAAFYNKRKQLHDKNKCHVVFDRSAGTIILVVDEQYSNDNYKISGSVTLNPDLIDFTINTGKQMSIKDLMDMLKFRRVFFKDKEANAKIVTQLQNYRATVQKVIAEISDNKGNDERSRLTKLEHELEADFVLSIPVYKGGFPSEFRVEICVEATSGEVKVWLESKELKEIQQVALNTIINDELKNFEEIVCIEQ